MPEFIFDGSDMEAVSRELREAADLVGSVTEKTVLEIGGMVAEAAKQIAGQHSSSIPGTIRVVPIPHGVAVRAGSAAVPLAALYDLGNSGRGGRRKPTFWHPVFGHRVAGIAQKRYPFFAPARKLLRKQINERMDDTWQEALEPYAHGGGSHV